MIVDVIVVREGGGVLVVAVDALFSGGGGKVQQGAETIYYVTLAIVRPHPIRQF